MADERVTPGKTDIGNVQKHIARYNLAMRFCEGKDVLDIACGTGYGTNMLGWVAKSVVGVDIDEATINYAKMNYRGKFMVGELGDFSYGKYDTIVSFETIEHIKDLQKAQDNLSNLLTPGGYIVYSVPLYENYHNEFHQHKFTVDSGLALFPEFTNTSYVIQDGMNFIKNDPKKPFTYLIVSKVKPL